MHQATFPGRSDGKESAWNARDLSSILGLGRFPGGDPQGRKMQKSKMAVWGGLINSCEEKRS